MSTEAPITTVPEALAACRRWIVTYSLDTNWLFGATQSVRNQAVANRRRDGADALIATLRYENERQARATETETGTPDWWTAEEWAEHHRHEAIVGTIHPAYRLEVAALIAHDVLTYEQVHGFVCTGHIPARQRKRRERRRGNDGQALVA